MSNEKSQESKVTCLFEDGNVHEHNEGSYRKMKEHSKHQEN